MTPTEQTKELKTLAVDLAEKITGNSFTTQRGALLDGEAEAYLIGYWYLRTREKTC
jgi:hypothetical protein